MRRFGKTGIGIVALAFALALPSFSEDFSLLHFKTTSSRQIDPDEIYPLYEANYAVSPTGNPDSSTLDVTADFRVSGLWALGRYPTPEGVKLQGPKPKLRSVLDQGIRTQVLKETYSIARGPKYYRAQSVGPLARSYSLAWIDSKGRRFENDFSIPEIAPMLDEEGKVPPISLGGVTIGYTGSPLTADETVILQITQRDESTGGLREAIANVRGSDAANGIPLSADRLSALKPGPATLFITRRTESKLKEAPAAGGKLSTNYRTLDYPVEITN